MIVIGCSAPRRRGAAHPISVPPLGAVACCSPRLLTCAVLMMSLDSGHHGAYQYDTVWFSDDGGKTYTTSKNASGQPIQIFGQDEIALAETPDGGVITSTRNEDWHRGYPKGAHDPTKINCNCRGVSRSTDGGTTFAPPKPDTTLVGPVCQATMLSVATSAAGDGGGGGGGGGQGGRAIFHANPGHGTDKESKSPPNGRATGTVRRSVDGGKTWEASVDLNGKEAYSYSCLTAVPQLGYVGLAYETVLPGSAIQPSASANNIVFTLVPQNFTGATVLRDAADLKS